MIVSGDVGKKQIKSAVISRTLNGSKYQRRVFPELDLPDLSGYFVGNSFGHRLISSPDCGISSRNLMDFSVRGII
jgi:hypothetical protein